MEKHKPQKIKITPRREGESLSHVHVHIDGTEIRNIRNMEIKVVPDEIPIMILDLNLYDISIDSEFLIYQKGVGVINFVKAEENPAED